MDGPAASLTEPPALSEQQLKKTVDELQAKLALAKGEYKTALRNLETISDEIHERRRSSAMGPRGRGVGAEGGSTATEDLSGGKPEPDAVSGELGVHVTCSCSSLPHPPPTLFWDTSHQDAAVYLQNQDSVVMFGKCHTLIPK